MWTWRAAAAKNLTSLTHPACRYPAEMQSIAVSPDHDRLSNLPAELLLRIISMLLSDARSLKAFLLVRRRMHLFIKFHEEVLVRTLAHHEDPLAYHLLYESHASFDAFFNLPHDEKIFQSLLQTKAEIRRPFERRCCFRCPGFWNSSASQLILRAGFLVYHGVTRIPQTSGKVTYIESLSLVQWTFLNIYIFFLVNMVHPVGYQIFQRLHITKIGKCSRIGRFIVELSVFGGLRVIQDYRQLLKTPLQVRSDAEIADWALSFESGYLKHGESVLSKIPEDHLPRLALLSEVSRNMRHMFGQTIHLGTQELDASDKYVFWDILTVLGVLPSAMEGETTLIHALNTLPKALPGDFQPRKIPIASYSASSGDQTG
jgi:hypothetical protein